MSDDVIKSFLVGLGFKIDEGSEKKFAGAMKTAVVQANLLASAIEDVSKAITKYVAQIAQSFDTLAFQSARTGATVQSLKSMEYAFKQVGGSAQQASGVIENFARIQRTNPGWRQFVSDLKIDPKLQGWDKIAAVVDKLPKGENYHVGVRQAASLGIDEASFDLMTRTGEAMRKYREERDRIGKSLGLNDKAAADASQSLMRSLGTLSIIVETLTDKLMIGLAPAMDGMVKSLLSWLGAHPETVEKIVRDITNAIIWLQTKMVEVFNYLAAHIEDGSLAKSWNEFALSLKKVADGIETIATQLKKLDSMFDGGILGGLSKIFGFTSSGGLAGLIYRNMSGSAEAAEGGAGTAAAEKPGIFRRAINRVGRALGIGGEGTQARPPEASGRYRPVYNLGDADLDQRVVNKIAGEAIANNGESVDAVINNMLNRVGSKGWGPSGNLREVALAAGQYAGNRAAGEKETAFIRDRIRAIASGGVPDNTNGANSYRASWYNGPWAKKHAADGRVVGGNRYGYEPGFPNGPYAPYDKPREAPAAPSPITINFPKMPQMNPGGFDVNRLTSTPPLGASSVNNSNSNTNNNSSTSTIHIYDAKDPKAVGGQVERAMGRAHETMLRNMQSPVS